MMSACTFFGHRDCPETIKPRLREVLVDLITNHDVNMFYVGHQGQFDAYVHSELKKLKQEYPQINYAVVLAYMPGKKTEYDDYSDTMLPEGIESVLEDNLTQPFPLSKAVLDDGYRHRGLYRPRYSGRWPQGFPHHVHEGAV